MYILSLSLVQNCFSCNLTEFLGICFSKENKYRKTKRQKEKRKKGKEGKKRGKERGKRELIW